MDDDLVLLEQTQSRYYGLDSIGRRIWELLEEPRTIGSLCTTLEAEFDVSFERCRTEVLAFLEQLEAAELVETRPGRAGSETP